MTPRRKALPLLSCLLLLHGCDSTSSTAETPPTDYYGSGNHQANSLTSREEILLWGGTAEIPQDPPGSNDITRVMVERIADSGTPNDPQRTLSQIKTPTLTVYVPEQPNGTSVVIVGGGGYTSLLVDKEGTDIARWFNTLGVTAFVLKMRLPIEGWTPVTGTDAPDATGPEDVPLQDGQRAIRIVRGNATAWGLNPDKIGMVGLSSGGHTASMIGTFYNRVVYPRVDATDDVSSRPNFMILAYGPLTCNSEAVIASDACSPGTPGYQDVAAYPEAKKALYTKYDTVKQVIDNGVVASTEPIAPAFIVVPTFIVTAHNDNKVDPENSLRFYQAVKRKADAVLPPLPKISAELHVFSVGGHGFAIRNAKGFPIAIWTALAKNWLAYNDFMIASTYCVVCTGYWSGSMF